MSGSIPLGWSAPTGSTSSALRKSRSPAANINAGIYVLEPGALDALNAGEHCDMPTLFMRLQERNARTIVYPMHEPWLDVGRKDDLEWAQTNHLPNAQR